jgi:hypothetical protein
LSVTGFQDQQKVQHGISPPLWRLYRKGWAGGIEVAIDDTTGAGFVDTGALYDLSKPSRNAMKPVGRALKSPARQPIMVLTGAGERSGLAQFTGRGDQMELRIS